MIGAAESVLNEIRMWEGLLLERIVDAALLCAQIGLLCTLTVVVLTFLAEVFEPVTRELRRRSPRVCAPGRNTKECQT